MQRYTIIYPPTISWNEPIFQRPHQMMREFAKQGHLAILSNVVPDGNGVHWFAEENLLITNDLHQTMSDPFIREQMAQTKVIFWVTFTQTMAYQQVINPDITIFDYIDECTDEFAHWKAGIEECMRISDHIFVVSDRLQELLHDQFGEKTTMLRNGADIRQYLNYMGPISPEIMQYKTHFRGVVGFHGSLQSWVDFELIAAAARMRPDLAFVFIGPEYFPASPLRGLPNVFLLGARPYHTLAQYVAGFDVGIIPFQIRDMTQSSNPIKMYEYLAAGKPVVATPLLECLKLAPYVRTAATPEEFVQKIEEALLAPPFERQAYQQIATDNSWSRRVQDSVKVFDQLTGERQ